MIKNTLGLNYNLTSNKAASIFVNTSFENWNELNETCLILVYNHHGYLFKFPVFLSNQ